MIVSATKLRAIHSRYGNYSERGCPHVENDEHGGQVTGYMYESTGG